MNKNVINDYIVFADNIDRAIDDIGEEWKGKVDIRSINNHFKNDCEMISKNRELDSLTIAFIGPKNSGKTQLLSLLIKNNQVRSELPVGESRKGATDKVIWISNKKPSLIDNLLEKCLSCEQADLEEFQVPITLIDVPAPDEWKDLRRKSAERALKSSQIKVLVVAEESIEKSVNLEYLNIAKGSYIIPVINKVRERNDEDIQTFIRNIRKVIVINDNGYVADPIVIEDYNLEGKLEEYILPNALSSIKQSINRFIDCKNYNRSIISQLEGRKLNYIEALREIINHNFKNSGKILDNFLEFEKRLPEEVFDHLFQNDEIPKSGIKQKLRSQLLENTSPILYPWRTFISISNIIQGAIDKIPTLMMASGVSFIGTLTAAYKNIRAGLEFDKTIKTGITEQIKLEVKEEIRPLLLELDRKLNDDIGLKEKLVRGEELEVSIEGIESFQKQSMNIFGEMIKKYAPNPVKSQTLGVAGILIFWGIFIWPVIGLYHDYFNVSQTMLGDDLTTWRDFPAGTVSMLLNGLILAIIPTGIFLLFVTSWQFRSDVVKNCYRDIKKEHESLVNNLIKKKLLRIKVKNKRLEALRYLFDCTEKYE